MPLHFFSYSKGHLNEAKAIKTYWVDDANSTSFHLLSHPDKNIDQEHYSLKPKNSFKGKISKPIATDGIRCIYYKLTLILKFGVINYIY